MKLFDSSSTMLGKPSNKLNSHGGIRGGPTDSFLLLFYTNIGPVMGHVQYKRDTKTSGLDSAAEKGPLATHECGEVTKRKATEIIYL